MLIGFTIPDVTGYEVEAVAFIQSKLAFLNFTQIYASFDIDGYIYHVTAPLSIGELEALPFTTTAISVDDGSTYYWNSASGTLLIPQVVSDSDVIYLPIKVTQIFITSDPNVQEYLDVFVEQGLLKVAVAGIPVLQGIVQESGNGELIQQESKYNFLQESGYSLWQENIYPSYNFILQESGELILQ